jgi:lipid-binding SYLF domain-containing protein
MRVSIGVLTLATAGILGAQTEAIPRISEAARVFQEIMGTPDKGIPQEIIERAKCIVIVPGMKKGGFIVGAQYGKGIITCRDTASQTGWTGISTIRIEGGSFGAQIGGGETDVVMMVMNEEGMRKLAKSEFTIGGDVGAMAGPVGRDASANTDAYMTAGILSYSRARGLFAGVTLNGATLRSDDKDNTAIYGKEVRHEDILAGKVKAPAAAEPLYSTLNKYWVAKGSSPSSSGERSRTEKKNK